MAKQTFNIDVTQASIHGELSDEGGMPIVQLHGLTSSRQRDRMLGLDLGTGLSGTRLVRYDARGHGKSTGRPVPEDYRWNQLADDLLTVLSSLFGEEPVYGVGQSMGAGTLLHAATRAPERFRGLTLLLPPTAWELRAARCQEYEKSAQMVEEEGFLAFAKQEHTPPPAAAGRPVTYPDVVPELLPAVFRGAALSDFPSREAIAAISVPTLILAWVEDSAHPIDTAQSLADLIPDATLSIASTPQEVEQWPGMMSDHAELCKTVP